MGLRWGDDAKYPHEVDTWSDDTDRFLDTLSGEVQEQDWLLDKSQEMKLWCAENCQGEWEEDVLLDFSFENANDALHFKLRWCNG